MQPGAVSAPGFLCLLLACPFRTPAMPERNPGCNSAGRAQQS
jgi:hypothetical protein